MLKKTEKDYFEITSLLQNITLAVHLLHPMFIYMSSQFITEKSQTMKRKSEQYLISLDIHLPTKTENIFKYQHIYRFNNETKKF